MGSPLHKVLISIAFSMACLIQATPKGLILTINQAITPPVLSYLEDSIETATQESYDFILIELDTPGGLYSTTRSIGQAILGSAVPIITYISPKGARAASAGTFITYASHVAAMAPGTHLGAATPIPITPQESETPNQAASKKIMSDTIAYIRSLAQYHSRNEAFGIQAVQDASSLTAQEAYKKDVIEVIASSKSQLLEKAHGLKYRQGNTYQTLNTRDATLTHLEPSAKNRILSTLTDPTITYLLLMAGIYGLILEFFNPGSIVPGTIGAVCILIASYGLQILPINFAGLALIILGSGFLVAEAFIPSFGIIGFAGVVAISVGSFFLYDGMHSWAMPSLWLMGGILITLTAALIGIIRINIQAHRRSPVSGTESLIGKTATVIRASAESTEIRIEGEIWTAHSYLPLHEGQRVTVIDIQGLTATIEPTGDMNE